MKPEELRIGNFVLNNACGSWEVCKVTAILKGGIEYDSVSRIGMCLYQNLKPIVITEEWLTGFNFDQDGLGSLIIWIGYIDILFSSNLKICWIKEQKVNIKHVHQLQNLYFGLALKELKKSKHGKL